MIYLYSDYFIYYFENIYPLSVYLKQQGEDVTLECSMERQDAKVQAKYKNYISHNTYNQILDGKIIPELVITPNIWWGRGARLAQYCKSKNIKLLVIDHATPMLLYNESKASYRKNLHGAIGHVMWGNSSADVMKAIGVPEKLVPALGSPRVDFYFKNNKRQEHNNDALILGTAAWAMPRNFNTQVEVIKRKHDQVFFKGHPGGIKDIPGVKNISFSSESGDFCKLLSTISHIYFAFPSSVMIFSTLCGCKNYALYAESDLPAIRKYFTANKDHILNYDQQCVTNKHPESRWLNENLAAGQACDSIYNFIKSNN